MCEGMQHLIALLSKFNCDTGRREWDEVIVERKRETTDLISFVFFITEKSAQAEKLPEV